VAMAMSQPVTGEAGAPAKKQLPLDKDTVLSEYNSRFKHAKSHWDEWRTESRNLYDLVAGRQWDPADEARLKDELRPAVTFNVSGKYMDVITGLQINNRQDIRFYPREEGDAKLNELMTGAVSWGRDLCNALDEETDAFYDAVLTGLGWMEGYLDKDLEPGGVPAGQRVDNLEMFPDPAARKRNLEDGRFCIRIRFVDHDEYEDLMGEEYGAADEDMADVETDDDAVELIEEPQDYDNSPGSSGSPNQKSKKCAIADYQFWRREKRWVATAQGQQKELTDEEYEAFKPFFEAAKKRGAPMQLQQVKRKVYYRAFIAKGKVGEFGLSPYQHGFTYHAITGKRDRNKNTWYGIGRVILDPQRWLNKFFSSVLYSIMTNAKGGLIAEEGAFKDARKAESEWAKPGSITWMKPGAIAGEKGPKFLPKPESPYPQGLDRLMEFTLGSMPQVTGMPVELMGLSDKVQPGVVEAQRKQSAMAIIAWAFDAMRRYYRSMGRQMCRYVVDYVPEGTLVMVNGEQSKQYVPLVKNQVGMTFDIVVDEAPTSVNQQERVWLALETLIPQLLQAGIPVTPKVLDYSPLPADLVQEWKKLISGDPRKSQYDEQTMMATLRKLVSEAMKNESQAKLNEAKAEEAGANSQLKGVQAITEAAHAGAAQAQNEAPRAGG
jgi:hypothetical protein